MNEEWSSLLRALRHLVRRARGNCIYIKYKDIARFCVKRGLTLPQPQKLHKLMRAFNIERDRVFVRGGKVTWILRRDNELWNLLLYGEYGEVLKRLNECLSH